MSEVANTGENQQPSAVQEANATVASIGDTVAATVMPAPTSTESVVATIDEKKQVTTNYVVEEGATGDAGSSSVEVAKPAETSPKAENKKTPAKRTPSKRLSFIERAQKESEELVKNMGGSLELEGGRRTRSSTRGTPTRAAVVSTPPPTKKARTSPANAVGTPSKGRARGRKIDTSIAEAEEETKKAAVIEQQSTEMDAEENATSEAAEVTDKAQNDPDDVETKDTADSNLPTEVAIKITATSVDNPAAEENIVAETVASVEPTPNETITDVALQTVPEEKQNNVDHDPAANKRAESPVAADSPMETEEQLDETVVPLATTASDVPATTDSVPVADKTAISAVAANAATEEDEPSAETIKASVNATVTKEPTPEPMEVDSNSKSNDDVEQVKEETAIISNAAAEAEENNSAQSQQADATDIATGDAKNNAKEIISNNSDAVDANEKATTAVENSNIASEASTLEESKKCEVAPADVTNMTTTTSENKAQPDFCEPKIASPSINANNDAAVTTPQFCN